MTAITGTAGDDTLTATGGVDEIYGLAGDDVVIVAGPMSQGDEFDGGDGTDTLRLDAGAIGLFEFGGGVVDFRGALLDSFERLVFNGSTDLGAFFRADQVVGSVATVVGDSRVNFVLTVLSAPGTFLATPAIAGLTFQNWTSGQDYIGWIGTGGADVIQGSEMSEYINGEFDFTVGAGNDRLFGNGGDDVLEGWGGRDEVFGGAGDDLLIAYNTDVVAGEIFDGGIGTDTIKTTGSTFLHTSTILGVERVSMEAAGTTSTVQFSSAQISASGLSTTAQIIFDHSQSAGTLALVVSMAAAGTFGLSGWNISGALATDILRINGTAGADTITGSSMRDYLFGAAGNDIIDGNGNDIMDGGVGDDTYIIRSLTTTIVDASGTDEAVAYVGGYVLNGNLENLSLGAGLNILTATGNGVDNRITGNEFDNELYGLAGNDVLNAGAGNDRLEGGLGIDTLYGGAGNDAMFGQDGIDRLEGEAGDDLMFGGEGDDVIIGGAGADRAWGENGVDLMFGGADNDSLLGEFGNDRLFGESGNDDLFGGVGDDQLLGEAGNDRLYGDVGADEMFGGDGLDLILGEDGDDRGYGGNDADDMFGQAGADLLLGELGNDRLWGGIGADLLFGQDGSDLLQGEQDNDRLFGGFGNDSLFGQDGNDELQGEQDNDRLFGGAGDDIMFGQAGDDELSGENGIDRLFGGDGFDVLWGGAGNDELHGEAGSDRYVFTAGGGADTLIGFDDGADLLDLRFYSGATIGNTVIAQVGANTLVTFVGGDSVTLISFTAGNLTSGDFLFA